LSTLGYLPFDFELPAIYSSFALDRDFPLASYGKSRYDSGSSSTLGDDSQFSIIDYS
jgi:hypothetical protein